MKIGDFFASETLGKIQKIIGQEPEQIEKFEIDTSYEGVNFITIKYKLPEKIKIEMKVTLPKEKSL